MTNKIQSVLNHLTVTYQQQSFVSRASAKEVTFSTIRHGRTLRYVVDRFSLDNVESIEIAKAAFFCNEELEFFWCDPAVSANLEGITK